VTESTTFGDVLREYRIAAGLSQEGLAERARLSVSGISALERGTRRAPQRETLAVLVEALRLGQEDREIFEAAAERQTRPRRRVGIRVGGGTDDRHNLPVSLTNILGRERELAMLQKRLSDRRLITLTGPGGVGKTRLALELARNVVARFPDGAWLVELAPLADPSLVAARVATTLGMHQPVDNAASDAWIGEFGNKKLLLVLDNCEHVLDAAAAIVQRTLERCPSVHVVATSREALRVNGEFVIRLDPLALPKVRAGEVPSIEDLRAAPAVKLFLARARDASPDFDLADGDEPARRALNAVCRRLDGMPLAIELAAARMNAMSIGALATALDRRFDVLAAGARPAAPRQQTLRALLDWSYGLLAETERRVFRRLAIFAGGWTSDAAQAVCRDDALAGPGVLRIELSLIDKSLIAADANRYSMLETTRAYALERLIEHHELERVSRAHAEHYRDLLERSHTLLSTAPFPVWLMSLEPELDNLRAALHWSLVEGADVRLGAAIAAGQDSLLDSLTLYGEGAEWCERALAALGPDPAPIEEAPLRGALARFNVAGSRLTRAREFATRAVALCRTLPPGTQVGYTNARVALANALSSLGTSLVFLGRVAEGHAAAAEAVVIARETETADARVWGLCLMSLTTEPSDMTARRALIGEAFGVARSIPDSPLQCIAYIAACMCEHDAGDYQRARKLARAATDYYVRTGLYEHMAVWALSLSSAAALAAGDVEGARSDVIEAIPHARRVRNRATIVDGVLVMAHVALAHDEPHAAARILGGADAMFLFMNRPQRQPRSQASYESALGRLRKRLGDAELEAELETGHAWNPEELLDAMLLVQ
jgi:predicted ATPase/DNA-binding XRE family transcriptional regulator